MTKHIGILTAGGDTPGLNAAIRAVGKTAMNQYGMHVVGFLDGFRGLMQNRSIRLGDKEFSGLLTVGGTILGTSRDKPHKMPIGGQMMDMTDAMVENYHKHHLDALICLGGGGTAKNAYRLAQKGINVLTLPKTIDNDVYGTDITFGYDTALIIATEAIDRLHSTAHSHHRIIVCEIMGHNTGWLALGAGVAGGADVILIPEIPYDEQIVADSILKRVYSGKRFSIVAISEGAMSKTHAEAIETAKAEKDKAKAKGDDEAKEAAKAKLAELEGQIGKTTQTLTEKLEELTKLESRVTILGHIQRGGTPSPADRLLATRLGAAAARCVSKGDHGVMIGVRGSQTVPVPLEEIVGKRKEVPLDHPWVNTARDLNTCMGD